jgi:hypothetical protein
MKDETTEDEASVKADADPDCPVCSGRGWHHGWHSETHDPVMLRCPCVDRVRADRANECPRHNYEVLGQQMVKYLHITYGRKPTQSEFEEIWNAFDDAVEKVYG